MLCLSTRLVSLVYCIFWIQAALRIADLPCLLLLPALQPRSASGIVCVHAQHQSPHCAHAQHDPWQHAHFHECNTLTQHDCVLAGPDTSKGLLISVGAVAALAVVTFSLTGKPPVIQQAADAAAKVKDLNEF